MKLKLVKRILKNLDELLAVVFGVGFVLFEIFEFLK